MSELTKVSLKSIWQITMMHIKMHKEMRKVKRQVRVQKRQFKLWKYRTLMQAFKNINL